MSQLFIHTELDGISQHFKTLAEISKKAWSVAEGACDDIQQDTVKVDSSTICSTFAMAVLHSKSISSIFGISDQV